MGRDGGLLAELKSVLREEFGERLEGLVLFGSEASGLSSEESDVDILVLLKGPIQLGIDVDRIITASYPLQLLHDRPLHLIPADSDDFHQGKAGFYRTVKKEGLPA